MINREHYVGIEIKGFSLILVKVSQSRQGIHIHKTLTVDARSKYFLHEKKALHAFLHNVHAVSAVFSSESITVLRQNMAKNDDFTPKTCQEIRNVPISDSKMDILYCLPTEQLKVIYDLLRSFQIRLQLLCPDTFSVYRLSRMQYPALSPFIYIDGRKDHLEVSIFKNGYWTERICLTDVKTKMTLEEVLSKHVSGDVLDGKALWSYCLVHTLEECEHLPKSVSEKLKHLSPLNLSAIKCRGLKPQKLDHYLPAIGASLLMVETPLSQIPNFTSPEIFESKPHIHDQVSFINRFLILMTLCFLVLGAIKYHQTKAITFKIFNLGEQIHLWEKTLEKHKHSDTLLKHVRSLRHANQIPLKVLQFFAAVFPSDFYIESLTQQSRLSDISVHDNAVFAFVLKGYCKPELWHYKTFESIRKDPRVRSFYIEKSKLLDTGVLSFTLHMEWL